MLKEVIFLKISNKYLLRYNNTDLSFKNGFFVVNWSGGGISDVVSTIAYGSGDGSYISNFRASDRQIIINIRVFTEEKKRELQQLFGQRKSGTLTYIPDDDYENAKEIDCVLVSAQPNSSEFPTTIPVTLLCAYPDWRSANLKTELICGTLNGWKFPWRFPSEKNFLFATTKHGNSAILDYRGTISTGFKVVITTLQALNYVKVWKFETDEYIKVEHVFPSNSEIVFNTENGNKWVKWKLKTDTEYQDVSNYIVWGSSFFHILANEDRVAIETDVGTDGVCAYIQFSEKTGGV